MYFLFENVLICMTCAASFAASFIDIDVFKHFKYIRMKNHSSKNGLPKSSFGNGLQVRFC